MESSVMPGQSSASAIAVLGGTFDPIHHGHLRLAIDVAEKLRVEYVRLMPGYQPVHREQPLATTEQRLQMLRLAVAKMDRLTIDERELNRKGASYLLLSLQELRAEIGENRPLFFILGEDAFCQFDQWHQWQRLLEYTHILVAVRPGNHRHLSAELQSFTDSHEYNEQGYPQTASGNIIWMDNVLLEIASSDIRKRITERRSIRYLLPERVVEYIHQQGIYR